MDAAAEARVAEIKARLQAATPGPWFIGTVAGHCTIDHGRGPLGHGQGDCQFDYTPEPYDGSSRYGGHQISSTPALREVTGNYDYEEGGIILDQDARFIAHAPEDIAYLLSLLDGKAEEDTKQ